MTYIEYRSQLVRSKSLSKRKYPVYVCNFWDPGEPTHNCI